MQGVEVVSAREEISNRYTVVVWYTEHVRFGDAV
jgi:hypothetical protein